MKSYWLPSVLVTAWTWGTGTERKTACSANLKYPPQNPQNKQNRNTAALQKPLFSRFEPWAYTNQVSLKEEKTGLFAWFQPFKWKLVTNATVTASSLGRALLLDTNALYGGHAKMKVMVISKNERSLPSVSRKKTTRTANCVSPRVRPSAALRCVFPSPQTAPLSLPSPVDTCRGWFAN